MSVIVIVAINPESNLPGSQARALQRHAYWPRVARRLPQACRGLAEDVLGKTCTHGPGCTGTVPSMLGNDRTFVHDADVTFNLLFRASKDTRRCKQAVPWEQLSCGFGSARGTWEQLRAELVQPGDDCVSLLSACTCKVGTGVLSRPSVSTVQQAQALS